MVAPRANWASGVAILVALLLASDVKADSPPSFLRAWGESGVGAGKFNGPAGVAIGPGGNVYVADGGNHCIHVFDPAGNPLFRWGTVGAGPGFIFQPRDVAVAPDGTVYVVDATMRGILSFTTTGTFLGNVGTTLDATGIAVDASGFLYVADAGMVRKWSPVGVDLGSWSVNTNGCTSLVDVAVDEFGNLYLAEFGCHRVTKLNPDGVIVAQWGSFGSGDGQFDTVRGIAVGGGRLYASDWFHHRVEEFTTDGVFLSTWGSEGSAQGQFGHLSPMNLAVNSLGEIFVCDRGNDRIQVFGDRPVPASASTWGRLKADYR
jgi:DNA-binding beta-propeller fold protein YncE